MLSAPGPPPPGGAPCHLPFPVGSLLPGPDIAGVFFFFMSFRRACFIFGPCPSPRQRCFAGEVFFKSSRGLFSCSVFFFPPSACASPASLDFLAPGSFCARFCPFVPFA